MNDATVVLVGSDVKIEGYAPAVSIDGPDQHSISDFIGESQSERLSDGRLRFKVTGRPLQGMLNEPNVLKVLAESLGQADYRSSTDQENRRGIDGYVESVPVQIVKTPSVREYGVAVAKGHWEITVTVEEAARWIKSAIDHKATGPTPSIAPADRALMFLALDVRHAGLLICDDVVAAVMVQMPDIAQLGFRAIWLVGSTVAGSRRLA
jgi:hypothetical protein